MLPQAIWLIPRTVPITDHRLAAIPEGSEVVVEGNVFPPVPEIATVRRDDRLIVGSDGRHSPVAGFCVIVRFEDVVAVQRWSDGARTLWGRGRHPIVHGSTWLGGDQVIEWIDGQVEAWLDDRDAAAERVLLLPSTRRPSRPADPVRPAS